MGFGFGYPPPWGFPWQLPPQFPANQWVNPEGSWAGASSSQQQFPPVHQQAMGGNFQQFPPQQLQNQGQSNQQNKNQKKGKAGAVNVEDVNINKENSSKTKHSYLDAVCLILLLG
jgi:hypothetical protein